MLFLFCDTESLLGSGLGASLRPRLFRIISALYDFVRGVFHA